MGTLQDDEPTCIHCHYAGRGYMLVDTIINALYYYNDQLTETHLQLPLLPKQSFE